MKLLNFFNMDMTDPIIYEGLVSKYQYWNLLHDMEIKSLSISITIDELKYTLTEEERRNRGDYWKVPDEQKVPIFKLIFKILFF